MPRQKQALEYWAALAHSAVAYAGIVRVLERAVVTGYTRGLADSARFLSEYPLRNAESTDDVTSVAHWNCVYVLSAMTVVVDTLCVHQPIEGSRRPLHTAYWGSSKVSVVMYS